MHKNSEQKPIAYEGRLDPPKSNITREESIPFKELRKDQERIVLTADKGVAMVVLDKKDYVDSGRFIGTIGLQDHQHRCHKQVKGQAHTNTKQDQKKNLHG